MDKSLINTNQIWMTGMSVSDGLFDDNWNMGISHKKVFIPFRTDKTTVYFDSRFTTQRELMEGNHIIIMDETEWDTQYDLLALVWTKE